MSRKHPRKIGHRVIRLGAVCSLIWSGCSFHRVNEEIAVPPLMPAAYSATGSAERSECWWQALRDPVLPGLIQQGLTDNLSLRAAWARLQQAEALSRQAAAGLFPTLDGLGTASRGQALGRDTEENRYAVDLRSAYEVDLWQRIYSGQRAAELDADVARETALATALLISAQIAETWFDAREAVYQLRLLEDQATVSRTFLDLVELRFSQGLASAVEVFQQREQNAATLAQIPPQQARLETAQHRLALLLGRPPKDITWPDPAKAESVAKAHYQALADVVGELPELGLPADLLLQRPDVRAARARVIAIDYRIAAAWADRFPAVRLSAISGWSDSRWGDLFSDWIWSLTGNLGAPLIDGGRRRAEVQRQQAAYATALAEFELVLLSALQEVEDALSREQQQWDLLERLKLQLQEAQRAYRESRLRYAMGLTEYLSVLAALRSQQSVERQILAAYRDLIGIRIALYQALGAAWETGAYCQREQEEADVEASENR